MRKLIITISIAFSGIQAMAQMPMPMQGSMAAVKMDTNNVAYDEKGNELHYYQYMKLVGSGEYTLRGSGGHYRELRELN